MDQSWDAKKRNQRDSQLSPNPRNRPGPYLFPVPYFSRMTRLMTVRQILASESGCAIAAIMLWTISGLSRRSA